VGLYCAGFTSTGQWPLSSPLYRQRLRPARWLDAAGLCLELDAYRYLGLPRPTWSFITWCHDVLALLWAYHWRVAAADRKEIPEQGGAATVRRLYVYGFSAAGLAMTTLAVVYCRAGSCSRLV